MGQYFSAVNTSKKEYVSLFMSDKMMEHSWIGNNNLNQIEILLTSHWAEDHIVWAGNHVDDMKFCIEEEKPEGRYDYNLYFEVKETDLYKSACNLPPIQNSRPPYILNHDKKEYVNLLKCPSCGYGDDMKIHPLPILTGYGVGMGLGDYEARTTYDKSFVGKWAGNSISMSFEKPEDFVEIIPNFYEGREDIETDIAMGFQAIIELFKTEKKPFSQNVMTTLYRLWNEVRDNEFKSEECQKLKDEVVSFMESII